MTERVDPKRGSAPSFLPEEVVALPRETAVAPPMDAFALGATEARAPSFTPPPSILTRTPPAKLTVPKTVLIFAAGGNAPGQNALLRKLILNLLGTGVKVLVVQGGLKTLAAPYADNNHPSIVTITKEQAEAIDPLSSSIDIGTTRLGDPDLSALAKNIQESGADVTLMIGGDGSLTLARLLNDRGIPIIGVPKSMDGNLAVVRNGKPERLLSIGYLSAVERASRYVEKLQKMARAEKKIMVMEVNGRNTGWIAMAVALRTGVPCFIGEHPSTVGELQQAGKVLQKTGGVILISESVRFLKGGNEISMQQLRHSQLHPGPEKALETAFTMRNITARSLDLSPLYPDESDLPELAKRLDDMRVSAQSQDRLNIVRVSGALFHSLPRNQGILFLESLTEEMRDTLLDGLAQSNRSRALSLIVVSENFEWPGDPLPMPMDEMDGANHFRYQNREAARSVARFLRDQLFANTAAFTATHLLMAEQPSADEVSLAEALADETAKAALAGKSGIAVAALAVDSALIEAPLATLADFTVPQIQGALKTPHLSPKEIIQNHKREILRATLQGKRIICLLDSQLYFFKDLGEARREMDKLLKPGTSFPNTYSIAFWEENAKLLLTVTYQQDNGYGRRLEPIVSFSLPIIPEKKNLFKTAGFKMEEIFLLASGAVDRNHVIDLLSRFARNGLFKSPGTKDAFLAKMEKNPGDPVPPLLEIWIQAHQLNPQSRLGLTLQGIFLACIKEEPSETLAAILEPDWQRPGWEVVDRSSHEWALELGFRNFPRQWDEAIALVPKLRKEKDRLEQESMRAKAIEILEAYHTNGPPDWWDALPVYTMALTTTDRQTQAYLVDAGLLSLGCPEELRDETAAYLKPLLGGLNEEAYRHVTQAENRGEIFKWARMFFEAIKTDPLCGIEAEAKLQLIDAMEAGRFVVLKNKTPPPAPGRAPVRTHPFPNIYEEHWKNFQRAGFNDEDIIRLVDAIPETQDKELTLRKFSYLIESGFIDQLTKVPGIDAKEYFFQLSALVRENDLKRLYTRLQSVAHLNSTRSFVMKMGIPPAGNPFIATIETNRDAAWALYAKTEKEPQNSPARDAALLQIGKVLETPSDEYTNIPLLWFWIQYYFDLSHTDMETVWGAIRLINLFLQGQDEKEIQFILNCFPSFDHLEAAAQIAERVLNQLGQNERRRQLSDHLKKFVAPPVSINSPSPASIGSLLADTRLIQAAEAILREVVTKTGSSTTMATALAGFSPAERARVYYTVSSCLHSRKKGENQQEQARLDLAYSSIPSAQPSWNSLFIRLQHIFKFGITSSGDVALAEEFIAFTDPEGAGKIVEKRREAAIQIRFYPHYEPRPLQKAFYGLERNRTIYLRQGTSMPQLLMEYVRALAPPYTPSADPGTLSFSREVYARLDYERKQDAQSMLTAARWVETMWSTDWNIPFSRSMAIQGIILQDLARLKPEEIKDYQIGHIIFGYHSLVRMRAVALTLMSFLRLNPETLGLLDTNMKETQKILGALKESFGEIPHFEGLIDQFLTLMARLPEIKLSQLRPTFEEGVQALQEHFPKHGGKIGPGNPGNGGLGGTGHSILGEEPTLGIVTSATLEVKDEPPIAPTHGRAKNTPRNTLLIRGLRGYPRAVKSTQLLRSY